MDLSTGFYETAKDDLSAAKCLYEAKLYPNSIFHIQQCVEKLSKAFGLINGLIIPKQVEKDISHKSQKVFTKQIAKTQIEFDKAAKLENIFPDFFNFELEGKRIDFLPKIKELKKDSNKVLHYQPEDFMWVSDENIDSLKKELESFNFQFEFEFDLFHDNFPKIMETLFQKIENITGKEATEERQYFNNKENLEELRRLYNRYFPIIGKVGYLATSLFFLSLVTAEHNQITRYPCIECGERPNEIYNNEETLVTRFYDIHNILETAFSHYEAIYLSK